MADAVWVGDEVWVRETVRVRVPVPVPEAVGVRTPVAVPVGVAERVGLLVCDGVRVVRLAVAVALPGPGRRGEARALSRVARAAEFCPGEKFDSPQFHAE